jgi:hypothetical protein
MMLWKNMSRDERLAAIRVGLARNLSYGQIAIPYGCSRNAVIGLARRHGLSSPQPAAARPVPKKLRVKKAAPPAPKPKAAKPAPAGAVLFTPRPAPVVIDPASPPVSRRVPLLLRSSLECPWIDDQRGTDGLATVCGHETEPGSHWCGFHRLKARKAA